MENQNTEWKLIWKDEYLRWICGFANAKGGKIYIGINDNGEIVGIDNYKKLLEDLPNKIRDILGIVPEINLLSKNGKYYLEIIIDEYPTPVSYKGHFYYRSGSTIQDLNGISLEKFFLNKMGRNWDGAIANNFSFDDLDVGSIELFREKARKSKRVPEEDINETDKNLIEALDLFSGDSLKRAAIISFGKKPEKLIAGAYVKIGFFRTHTDLLYQDEIHGSLLNQAEKTMDLLLTKYMRANIAYEGLTRTETYDFPEKALREALLNALIHKDYSSGNPIQISVYSDWLMIYNSGKLPDGWTMETLKKKHTSQPANPDIANVFFRAGYIEEWGRGTVNVVKYCTDAGLPEPVYEGKWGGVAVIFTKKEGSRPWEENEIPTDTVHTDFGTISERFRNDFGTNELNILKAIYENPYITATELSKLINKSSRTVEKYIALLKKNGIIIRKGAKLGGYWEIVL